MQITYKRLGRSYGGSGVDYNLTVQEPGRLFVGSVVVPSHVDAGGDVIVREWLLAYYEDQKGEMDDETT